MQSIRKALTIAGSDSGAGAGIQADLKTFAAHGVYGTSAITAITAQNTVGVTAVLALSPRLVAAQIDAIIDDIGAHAVKTGMLANQAIIDLVARKIAEHRLKNVVVDPVMVATSGDLLIRQNAIAVLRSKLIPLATVVTPNIPEAEVLTGMKLRTAAEIREAAQRIVKMGAKTVIVKGGHLKGPATDLFSTARHLPRSMPREFEPTTPMAPAVRSPPPSRRISPRAQKSPPPWQTPSATSPQRCATATASAQVTARCIIFIDIGKRSRLYSACRNLKSGI